MGDSGRSVDELRAELDDVCAVLMDDRFAPKLAALARPAVRMRAAARGATELGPVPHAAPDPGWPLGADGSPLTHLCSIDLVDLARFETGLELPSAGILQAFFEIDVEPGVLQPTEPDSFVLRIADSSVIASPGVGVELTQVLTIPAWYEPAVQAFAPAAKKPEFNRRGRNRAELLARARGEEVVEVPKTSDHDRLRTQVNDVHQEWGNRIESLVGPGPQHQIGGWPALVQTPLWGECEEGWAGAEEVLFETTVEVGANPADRWAMVIQIDTDEEAGWMWGDAGLLYFAARTPIEPAGLLRGSWCVAQSY